MKEFIAACKKIESDKNYQPNITDQGLLSLVVNKDGSSKHTPRRSTLIIQDSNIYPVTEKGDSLGKLYQIKIANKGPIGDDDFPIWHVNDSAVMLINMSGECSFHIRENAEKGNFNSPLTHLNIDSFLNQRSLAFIETQKQIAEIKANSQILAQATRTRTSFFAQLPSEILVKIAALTGDKEIISENEANRIAYDNFDRPKLGS